MNMPNLLGSTLRMMIVLWLAVTLVFFLLRLLPGDPVAAEVYQAGGTATQVAQRRAALGLRDSVWVQYQHYLVDLGKGDLGTSWLYKQPVLDLILDRLLPTLSLGLAAFAVATAGGFVLGISHALASFPLIRIVSESLITMALSVPIYLSALVVIYFFSISVNILPVFGEDTPLHLVLPAFTLGFHASGSIAHVFSSNLHDVFQQPYMLTARAKGLPPIDLLDHAMRVALLPTLSVMGLQAGFLLNGTVIIEFIFARKGLGSLLYQAVQGHDYPLVQALALLGASVYLITNGLSAYCRRRLDPRLSLAVNA